MATSSVNLFRYAMANVLGPGHAGQRPVQLPGGRHGADGRRPGAAQLRRHEYEFYLQDTWKADRALTVTAGIR